jgi:hypothetical protein
MGMEEALAVLDGWEGLVFGLIMLIVLCWIGAPKRGPE